MNDKLKDFMVIIVFSVILFGILFLNIIKKDEKISISERRKLATLPSFTVRELVSRKFCKQVW